MSDEERDDRGNLGFLASRFLRAGAEAVAQTGERIRERGEDLKPRDIVRGAAGLTARGKDEVMALLAREVRSYIEHLGLVEEVERFATTHTLEVNASFRLKPLDGTEEVGEEEPGDAGEESGVATAPGSPGEPSPSPSDSEA